MLLIRDLKVAFVCPKSFDQLNLPDCFLPHVQRVNRNVDGHSNSSEAQQGSQGGQLSFLHPGVTMSGLAKLFMAQPTGLFVCK